ncbi:Dual oxidase 1 [Trichinella nelsoni]|uniref:NAD(P)H oxidase (H2O2-forming) n=1 Tax=Trichinella nelsoni TaxID=6336 RepID=A0A0V0SII8_9BILA|nr:Dual oxidase 1 [Trichinella nelsoni]
MELTKTVPTVMRSWITVVMLCHIARGNWEFQRYDGWYNNLAHPEWGTAGSRLYRQTPNAYLDGVYQINDSSPNVRVISNLVFKGPDGIRNSRNVTTMFAFFSQMVAYEILQSTEISCPMEMHHIAIERCDPIFDAKCTGKIAMPYLRAKYDKNTGLGINNPREQLNERTSWIDGSILYSVNEPWLNIMRSFENGTLREGLMKGYPPLNAERLPLINPPPPQLHRLVDPERMFMLGDPRMNENPPLLAFGLMLYRWHNKQAEKLQQKYPHWSDVKLFERARRFLIAHLQNIIMYEFLPALLDEPTKPYEKYNPHLPPGISHEFAVAAFRYPHTMVPAGTFLRNGQCQFETNVGGYPALRLCNTWWNAQDELQRYGMDKFILGMASQVAEEEDRFIVSDLKDFVFGPMHFSRRDLPALSLMRGRDNGLPDYNTIRKSFDLPAVDWHTINPDHYSADPQFYEKLKSLYGGNITKMDMYIGGILEFNNGKVGELFKRIIRDQFYRIRDADRFWFENRDNKLFTEEEIQEIKNVRLYDMIIQTTGIKPNEIQKDVFFWKNGDPCPQPFQLNISILEPCIPFMRHDHFMGNEVSFIYSCIALGIVPVACVGIAMWMVRRSKKRRNAGSFNINNANIRKELNSNTDENQWKKEENKVFSIFHGIEWLHEHYCRSVVICLDKKPAIRLLKRRGGLLRSVCLEAVKTCKIFVSDRAFLLMVFPDDYDMVLRFDSYSSCTKLLRSLELLLRWHGKDIEIKHENTERLLAMAETVEIRKQKLEHFFREAYAKAFNVPEMRSEAVNMDDVSQSVLQTMLTKAEFADALGMDENDLIIQRLFRCVARQHPDKICFRDFLDVVIKFANGTIKEKLQILFNMCDRRADGHVDKKEFAHVIQSAMSNAGTCLRPEKEAEAIENIFRSCGIDPKKEFLTLEDFEIIHSEFKGIGLHLKGRNQHILNKTSLERTESICLSVPVTNREFTVKNFGNNITSWLEDYRQHITCLTVFFTLCFAVFFERFWHFYSMSEHGDLRRTMGLGISFSRASAAVISLCMGVILLTVCRNIITWLRETPLGYYIPFDATLSFHKIVGITTGIFSAIHTAGHCINFYHISTHDLEGLKCLFQDAVFDSDMKPSISYWLYGTVTGVTGILLVLVMSVMYVFSLPSIINSAYHAFRVTHLLNFLLYALTIIHGLQKLLTQPSFWYYITVPAVLLVLDRLVSLKNDYKQLEILSAELLPSDITFIKFKRPRNFHFRSGQWVRIRCSAFNCKVNEWHAFTLASTPDDRTLKIYVKAQGPWTWKLRESILEAQQYGTSYPLLQMDGPNGAGNQDWYNYEVCIMIAAGIGVTPYASVLMDAVKARNSSKHSDSICRKIYFFWICPTYKNYDWFIEILRKAEEEDKENMVETHIFVTQFFYKYDLRTTMLYICEKHFRIEEGRSMFTNLKATNHFGRPNLEALFGYVQSKHPKLNCIGVFSCGLPSVNKSVQNTCEIMNRRRKTHFVHKFEAF